MAHHRDKTEPAPTMTPHHQTGVSLVVCCLLFVYCVLFVVCCLLMFTVCLLLFGLLLFIGLFVVGCVVYCWLLFTHTNNNKQQTTQPKKHITNKHQTTKNNKQTSKQTNITHITTEQINNKESTHNAHR